MIYIIYFIYDFGIIRLIMNYVMAFNQIHVKIVRIILNIIVNVTILNIYKDES